MNIRPWSLIDAVGLLRRMLRQTTLGALLALLVHAPAYAHKLNLFIYVEAGQVHVEGYFADGAKAKSSDVTVTNSAREVVFEGKTDDEGQLSFPVRDATELRVVLNAGLGHQAEYTLTAAELGGKTTVTSAVAPLAAGAATAAPAAEEVALTEPAAAAAAISAAQLNATVEKAVAEAVRPLSREISELKSKTSLADIIGGIGYIIGILGLFAYQKARRADTRG